MWLNLSDKFKTASKTELLVPARYLDLGTYRFELNVTMVGEEGIFSTNYTDYTIVKSPLIGGFPGDVFKS